MYEIQFKRHLSSYRAQVVEGLEMVEGPDGQMVLTGPMIEQVALHGILSRIHDMSVPSLPVKRVQENETNTERSGPK